MALARTRLIVSLLAGAVTGAVLVALAPWQVAVLAGWVVAAAAWVGQILVAVLPRNADDTASLASREDNSRFLADTILLLSSVASLVGVALGMVKASGQDGGAKAVTIVLVVLTVLASWLVVHVTFLLRYARLYFGEGGKGVDFSEDSGDRPDYRDFAYLALTIGMTFQVSDTALTTKAMRRTALHHSLLSYVFGTVIVATTINVVAGLLGGGK